MAEPLEYESAVEAARPTALTVVAWIFIISGILAGVGMIIDLFQGRFTISLGVLGIFIGRGLLRWSRGWRTCALVFLWLGFILLPIIALMALSGVRANVTFFGVQKGTLPGAVMLIPCAAFFLLLLWQYRVLTRPDIRARFLADSVSVK